MPLLILMHGDIGNIAENLAEIKKKKNWIQNFLSAFPLSLKYLQVILS